MSAIETRERTAIPCPAPAMQGTTERRPSPEAVEAPFLAQLWAVARKDLLLEARSRERLLSMGTFAVLVAVVFSFAVDPSVRARSIAGAMIWVTVLFAGTLGLGRSIVAPVRRLERTAAAIAGGAMGACSSTG